jgi:hypothetical protein
MTNTTENDKGNPEGPTCQTGTCGTDACSPCAVMKLVMLGILVFAGLKYLIG